MDIKKLLRNIKGIFYRYISKKKWIDYICAYYGINDYTINDDFSIDVHRIYMCSEKLFKKFPITINCVEYFYCSSETMLKFYNPNKVKVLNMSTTTKLKNTMDIPPYDKIYFYHTVAADLAYHDFIRSEIGQRNCYAVFIKNFEPIIENMEWILTHV